MISTKTQRNTALPIPPQCPVCQEETIDHMWCGHKIIHQRESGIKVGHWTCHPCTDKWQSHSSNTRCPGGCSTTISKADRFYALCSKGSWFIGNSIENVLKKMIDNKHFDEIHALLSKDETYHSCFWKILQKAPYNTLELKTLFAKSVENVSLKAQTCYSLILEGSPESLASLQEILETIPRGSDKDSILFFQDVYRAHFEENPGATNIAFILCTMLAEQAHPLALNCLKDLVPTFDNNTWKKNICDILMTLESPEAISCIQNIALSIDDSFSKSLVCEDLLQKESLEAFSCAAEIAATADNDFFKAQLCLRFIEMKSLEFLPFSEKVALTIYAPPLKQEICENLIKQGSPETLESAYTIARKLKEENMQKGVCEAFIAEGSPEALLHAQKLAIDFVSDELKVDVCSAFIAQASPEAFSSAKEIVLHIADGDLQEKLCRHLIEQESPAAIHAAKELLLSVIDTKLRAKLCLHLINQGSFIAINCAKEIITTFEAGKLRSKLEYAVRAKKSEFSHSEECEA